MKKLFLLLLMLSCAALCWAEPEGTGTADDPYQLASAEDLLWFVANTSGSYSVLTDDIDLSAASWEPVGTEEAPFTGNINGQGFSINGFYCSDIEKSQAGLFAYASNCTIENLGLYGSVECVDDGGLLFAVCDRCTVKNVTLNGSVSGSYSIGLLAGRATYLTCTLTSASGIAEGTYDTGGLVGFATDCTIENCFTVVDVEGSECAGGIAGYAEFTTINCTYAAGSCTGVKKIGGIVGKGEATITSSYFDKSKARAGEEEAGTGVTTEAMLKKATYVGFDFMNYWTIEEGVSTPTFLVTDDPLFWSLFTETATCRITIKGTLSGEDLLMVELYKKIGLRTLEEGVFLTTPMIVDTFPYKTKEEKVTYNEKKNQFRYTAKNQKLTVAYEDINFIYQPCDLQIDKCTIDFTGTLAKTITKDTLRYRPFKLCDQAMTGVLSGTAFFLDKKGNNLVYKSKTVSYKVNLKNGKFNAKATLTDTVQGAYAQNVK